MIKKLYKNFTCHADEVLIYKMLAAIFALIVFYYVFNLLGKHYEYANYCPIGLIKLAPIAVIGVLAVTYCREEVPRTLEIIWAYCCLCLAALLVGFLATSIQVTPFPYIDSFLVKADLLLGFHSAALLQFTHTHPGLRILFQFAYDSLTWQLALLPYLVPLFKGRRRNVFVYLFAMSLSAMLGFSIYFFLPTVGPAHLIHSPYFSAAEHNTYTKFFDIHHFIDPNSMAGGLIAFPSFHVIWAVLITYLCRTIKWLLYPLILLNIVLVAATLFLGWHYLTDVIAGFVIAGACLYVAERCIKTPYFSSGT